MIFGAFFLIWIVMATSYWMLTPPIILLAMREMYLDRGLRFNLLGIPVITNILIFLFMLVTYKRRDFAILEAGRIFASSMLLIHLAYGALKDGPSYTGIRIGAQLIILQRSLILEKKMIWNAVYSYRMRRRHSRFLSRETLNLVKGLILTATSEFLKLAEDLGALHRSRGKHPATQGWVVPRSRRIPITFGDIIMIISIGVIARFGLNPFIPSRIVEAYTAAARW
jgi:hypothetical protein